LCVAAGAAQAQPIVVFSTNATSLQGGQSATLTATVTGTSNAAVTWSYSPTVTGASLVPGGLSGIASTAVFHAPSLITVKQVVTITAASVADPTQAAYVLITLTPVTVTVTVSPSTATLFAGQSQQFTANVSGTSVTGVTWSINSAVGSIDSAGLYTAPPVISANQTVTVTAASNFAPASTGTATITLQTIGVTVTPSAVSLTNNQTQQFTATVAGTGNTAVNWSISPQTGAIDGAGLYTAPVSINGTPKVTVTATSVADSSKSGSATVTLSAFIDVGTGAPTPLMQSEFQAAFNRNGFNALVSLPPQAQVVKLGTTGYIQRFNDSNKNPGVTLALATSSATVTTLPDGSTPLPVVQLWSPLYAYYNTVGAITAGYPIMDTQNCPAPLPSGNTCTYDIFDKNYALFAFAAAMATGQNFSVSAGFYTEWTNLGGIDGPGPPIDVTTAITASTGTTATQLLFASGALYNITGTNSPNRTRFFGVIEPFYDLYFSDRGPAGSLGLPTSDQFLLANGDYRQLFEGGALEYTPGGPPVIRLPVASVALIGVPGTNVTLNLGATLTLTAMPYTSTGTALTDRPISWTSTNGAVIAIQANGATAVLQAVGGGAAGVVASSEGVSSPRLAVVVIAPCCQVGDGAPLSVQQAFQAALARGHVTVQTPVASPAARLGAGYAQTVQSANATAPATYLLAEADASGTAYLVSGALLAYYLAAGGPAGALGYPIGDASPGGTQLFQNSAALAGNPVRLVSGAVLAKWALLGYETGAAGTPAAEASAFSTFGAISGALQSFTNGDIYAANAGPRAGQAYFVSGLILAAYTGLGGAGGSFGMPVGDEIVTGSLHQQNFEGGSITYSAGESVAQSHPVPMAPGVVVAPATITAGGSARLAIVGFPNNATINVSVTGEPAFVVTPATGAYIWDMFIPLSAASGAVNIHAAGGGVAADGAFTIKGFDQNRIAIAKTQGDNQTGPPGALLPLALQVVLVDASGSPVEGAQVVFQASPGVQLSAAGGVTDSHGQAQTQARLPNAAGLALVTADSPGIARSPVTFGLIAAAAGLTNFPAMEQSGSAPLGNGAASIAQKGALLTAVAAIFRYRQNRGDVPSPHGLADPGTLNQFLTSLCTVDAKGNQMCDGYLSNPDSGEQVVNLWRAVNFTGGLDVVVDTAAPAAIADRVAQGAPVLLSLALSLNGTAVGGHYVVATGVAADGSIVIQDPNPFFARSNLNDYLNGFSGAGGTWQATLRSAVEFALRSPSATRFLVAALSQPNSLMQTLALGVASAAGACGVPLDLLDAVDSSGSAAPGLLTSRIQVCDGSQAAYEVDIGASQKFRALVTDLASGGTSTDLSGSAPAAYRATRPLLALVLTPQNATVAAGGVVNAATFTSGIAPGGIMAIFGTGLSGPGFSTSVDVDGATAPVLFASPFQVNAQVPPGIAPGAHTLNVHSAFGAVQQTIAVSAIAPAIFLIGDPPVGAVANQDSSLNGPTNPLPRGQTMVIYCTGLGATSARGQYAVTNGTVTAVLNGTELPVTVAGLTPGYLGLYQVNVAIPAAFPPGLAVSLALKEAGLVSNSVLVALQ